LIIDEILKEIDNSTFLSVQVDETTDVSTKEQLSMIVRLDKGCDIIERQLGFVDVSSDRTANAISTVIKGKLIQHENIKENLLDKPMMVHRLCLVMSMVFKLNYNKSILLPILFIVQLIG